MRQTPSGLSPSATDLSNSLACRQLTGLDMAVVLEGRKRPFRNDPMADILKDRGLAHEKAYVDHLKSQGREVVDLHHLQDPQAAAAATLDAMRKGQASVWSGSKQGGCMSGDESLQQIITRQLESGEI